MQKLAPFLYTHLLIRMSYALAMTVMMAVAAVTTVHAQNTSRISNPDRLLQNKISQSKIEKGKLVSRTHCTRCHVVGDFNPHGGISSTPSFSLLVNHLDDWEDRFMSFHTRRPHPVIIYFRGEKTDANNPPPSIPVILEYSDIEAITAFAKTLQKTEAK